MGKKETNPVGGFFMLGLMLGAAVGAAIGLLYAPRPGSESRREMSLWADDVAGRASGGTDAPEEPQPGPSTEAPV